MRINSVGGYQGITSISAPRSASAPAGAAGAYGSSGRPSDGVSLSSTAQGVQRAQAAAAAAPDTRAERVAGIKAQVDAGTYQIDNHALAEKLLSVL